MIESMNVGPEDFRRHFGILSDEALLATREDDLVESAQECYIEELSRRGLTSGATVPESIATEDVTSGKPVPGEEAVTIATFEIGEEANLARGLLQSASIPSYLANEHAGLRGVQLQLMVPAAFAEQALEVLGAEISEDELAAQAEAAVSDFEDYENEVEDSGNERS
jgi:hypothetical protein